MHLTTTFPTPLAITITKPLTTTDVKCEECPSYLPLTTFSRTFCLSCPSGYASTPPPGSAAAAADEHGCWSCQKGRMSLTASSMQGGSACTNCKAGMYQPLEKMATCFPCIPGMFQSQNGSQMCHNCANNTFANNMMRKIPCSPCDIGTSSRPGATRCTACTAGKFGQGCSKCAAGKFRIGNHPNTSACQFCPPGFAQPSQGTAGCLPCVPGKAQHLAGQSFCADCAVNTFANTTEMTSCVSCAKGKKAESTGAATCVACAAGEYGTDASCLKCDPGYYRAGDDTDASACKRCPSGFHQDATGQAACLPCIPGKAQVSQGKGTCTDCAPNSYTNVTKRMTCSKCPTGRTSSGGSASCSACAAGKYINPRDGTCFLCSAGRFSANQDSVACEDCPIGASSPPGSPSCLPCDLGMFGDALGSCSNCVTGTYQDGKGETGCKPCPEDTFGASVKATSRAMCTRCAEDRTTGKVIGASDEKACLCRRGDFFETKDGACKRCPDGGNCSARDSATSSEIVAQNGYWRPYPGKSNDNLVIIDCSSVFGVAVASGEGKRKANERCCPPGRCRLGDNTSKMINTQCADGYTGVLCMACDQDAGYILRNGNCVHCTQGYDVGAAAGVIFGMGLALFFVLLLVLVRIKAKTTSQLKLPPNRIIGQCKILCTFGQILSSMPVTMNAVPFPKLFVDFSIAVGAPFNLDVLHLFSVSSCAMALPPLKAFVAHISMLPVFTTAIFGAYRISLCCKGAKHDRGGGRGKTHDITRKDTVVVMSVAKVRWSLAIKVWLVVAGFMFPGLANRIFSAVRCREIVGIPGAAFLYNDYSVRCGEQPHASFAALAIVCMVFVVMGIPGFIFFLLWKHRSALNDTCNPQHAVVKFELGGLYATYDADYWYFEVVIMNLKMLMTGALCLAMPGSPVQPVIAIFFLCSLLLVVLKTAPFRMQADDWMSFSTTLAMLITTFVGLLLMYDVNAKTKTFAPDTLGILLLIMNATVMATQAILIIFIKWRLCKQCPLTGDAHNHSEPAQWKVYPKGEKLNPKSAVRADTFWGNSGNEKKAVN